MKTTSRGSYLRRRMRINRRLQRRRIRGDERKPRSVTNDEEKEGRRTAYGYGEEAVSRRQIRRSATGRWWTVPPPTDRGVLLLYVYACMYRGFENYVYFPYVRDWIRVEGIWFFRLFSDNVPRDFVRDDRPIETHADSWRGKWKKKKKQIKQIRDDEKQRRQSYSSHGDFLTNVLAKHSRAEVLEHPVLDAMRWREGT